MRLTNLLIHFSFLPLTLELNMVWWIEISKNIKLQTVKQLKQQVTPHTNEYLNHSYYIYLLFCVAILQPTREKRKMDYTHSPFSKVLCPNINNSTPNRLGWIQAQRMVLVLLPRVQHRLRVDRPLVDRPGCSHIDELASHSRKPEPQSNKHHTHSSENSKQCKMRTHHKRTPPFAISNRSSVSGSMGKYLSKNPSPPK